MVTESHLMKSSSKDIEKKVSSLISRIQKKIHTNLFIAHSLLQKLLSVDLSNADPLLLSNVYKTGSLVEFSLGNNSKAREYAVKSLDYAKLSNNKKSIIVAENALGRSYYLEGYYGEALRYFQSSISSIREMNDTPTLATTLNNIGACYMNMGLWSNSLENHLEALTIRRNSGDKDNTAQSLTNIGLVYYQLKEYEKCLEYQTDAEKICIDIGNTALHAAALANKALSLFKLEKYDQGLTELEKSIEINKKSGDKHRLAIATLNKSSALYELKQYENAKAIAHEAIALGEEVGDIHTISVGYHTLGKVELSLGNYTFSEELLLKALDLSKKLNLILEERSTHQVLAELYSNTGEWQKAYEHLNTYYVIEQTKAKEEADTKFNHFKVLHEIEKIKTETFIEQERNSKLTELLQERDDAFQLLEKQNRLLEELHREKNEFIGIASHDLKNPLVGLRSYCQMLISEFENLTQYELRESLHTIFSTADKTFAIVAKLLDVNRIESGEIDILSSPVDVGHLVKSLARIYSEPAILKGITLKTEFHGNDSIVWSDETLTVQILDNLISNAIKFSPPESKVTIRVFS